MTQRNLHIVTQTQMQYDSAHTINKTTKLTINKKKTK